MTPQHLELIVIEPRLAVCRLGGAEPIPGWAIQSEFFSVTRTAEELSIVCPDNLVPEGMSAERGWRALRVAGVLDLSVIGVLASLAVPIARAGISLFAISTFDTDYLLVKDHDLRRAAEALREAGHTVKGG